MRRLTTESDKDLLRAISNDDEKAFEELFIRYCGKVHSMAYSRLECKETTKEIVNDVFLNIWERRHSLAVDNFSHYIFVAVKYRAISYIAKQTSKNKYYQDYVNSLSFSAETVTDEMQYQDLLELVGKSVKSLPEKSKQIFHLHKIEGRPVSEIARLFNLSEKAIQYHITRSLKELRLYLKDGILTIAVSFILSQL